MDTGEALTYQEYLDGLCGGCRTPLALTTDPAAEDAWKADSLVCHKCRTAEEGRAAYLADEPGMAGGNPAGVIFYAVHRQRSLAGDRHADQAGQQ